MAERPLPIRETLSEITTCPVCKSHFQDPRYLPCFHTFCRQCIDTHHQQMAHENLAECPLCRRGFVLSLSGAAELPPSFVTTHVLDAYRIYFSPSFRQISCISLCELCKTNKQAANNCNECNLKMCNSCTKIHDTLFHEKHFVYSIENEEKSVLYMKEKENGFLCTQHKYLSEKYCTDCSIYVCGECEKEFHVHHSLYNLRSEVEDRRKMSSLAEEMREHVLKNRSYVTNLTQSKQDIINEKENIAEQIKEESEYFHQVIISRKNELLKELDTMASNELDHVEAEKMDVSETINSLTFMFKTAEIFVREASEIAISAEFTSMENAWERIQSLNKRKSSPKSFGLVFDSKREIFDKNNAIGNIRRKSVKEDDGYAGVDHEREDITEGSSNTFYQTANVSEDLPDIESPQVTEKAPPLPPRQISSSLERPQYYENESLLLRNSHIHQVASYHSDNNMRDRVYMNVVMTGTNEKDTSMLSTETLNKETITGLAISSCGTIVVVNRYAEYVLFLNSDCEIILKVSQLSKPFDATCCKDHKGKERIFVTDQGQGGRIHVLSFSGKRKKCFAKNAVQFPKGIDSTARHIFVCDRDSILQFDKKSKLVSLYSCNTPLYVTCVSDDIWFIINDDGTVNKKSGKVTESTEIHTAGKGFYDRTENVIVFPGFGKGQLWVLGIDGSYGQRILEVPEETVDVSLFWAMKNGDGKVFLGFENGDIHKVPQRTFNITKM